MRVKDQLEWASLHTNGSDLTPTSTGLIYFNTSTNKPKYYNGSAWRSIMDLESTEDVSGVKTFSNGIELDSDVDQDVINYYREHSMSATWTWQPYNNPGKTTAVSRSVSITRIGRLVNLVIYVDSLQATSSSADYYFQWDDTLPSWARPAANTVSVNCWMQINSAHQPFPIYLLRVTSAGKIQVYKDDAGNWSSVPDTGFSTIVVDNYSLTYIAA